ncbi:hypothetical protein [Nonomuraea sp. NPDC049758]|uniref:hypothetical protein n=1 Tax=Nonomuraea sp. NPDC049758 TaxID=3154360 RepID=UPI0034139BDB
MNPPLALAVALVAAVPPATSAPQPCGPYRTAPTVRAEPVRMTHPRGRVTGDGTRLTVRAGPGMTR